MPQFTYRIDVDNVTPSEWSSMLGLFEDSSLYQTWSYGAVRWGPKNLSHLVVKRDGQPVAMAQLRIVRPSRLGFGIAHLRWGPVCHTRGSELDAKIVRTVAAALYDEYVTKRGLFLRVLPKGFLETPRASIFQSAFHQYRSEDFGPGESYRTFVLDLEPPLDVLRKQLDQKWRNQLNRAEKNGLAVVEGEGAPEFHTFIRIYDEMCARKQLEQASDIRESEQIQQDLPSGQRMRLFICQHDGAPAAGLVGAAMGDTGIYLLGATNEQGMKSKAAYLLQWRMIQWLKELGVKYYNLGGINPQKNPGVYHFKQGLSGQDLLYMKAFVSCTSVVSSAFARTAELARGRLRAAATRLLMRS